MVYVWGKYMYFNVFYDECTEQQWYTYTIAAAHATQTFAVG